MINDKLATRGCFSDSAGYQSATSATQTPGKKRQMPTEFEVESFIGSCFRSVWAIELVQLLLANPGQTFSAKDLVKLLRASDAVVRQSVDALSSVGLIVIEDDRIRLHIGSEQTGAMLEAAGELYKRRPDRVRRLIISAASPGLSAFADAFRLRKD